MTIPDDIHYTALSQSVLTAIDARVKHGITENVFPAAAICVHHRGKPVLNAAWGWQGSETEIPLMVKARFDLASLTKLLTTTAFLMQVEQGRVSLDALLVDTLPEFGAVNPRPIGSGQNPFTKVHLPVLPEFI
ncbi:MAG: serine hydrolase domain-containing protein, partial [Chloroflexota bacterium]